MSDERAGLLAAIVAAPADNTPRLVYADWLDDHAGVTDADRTRADLIRRMIDGAVYPGRFRARGTSRPPGWYWDCSCEVGQKWPSDSPACGGYPGYWADQMRAALGHPPRHLIGGGWMVVRRGFLDEIQLQAPELVGEPCRVCEDGRGAHPAAQCPTCQGKRFAEGGAGAAFASHPVTRIILTDKGPQLVQTARGGRGYSWASHHQTDVPQGCRLPAELFQNLRGYDPQLSSDSARWYHSLDAARDAVSDAAVRYGRYEAGLPPLSELVR